MNNLVFLAVIPLLLVTRTNAYAGRAREDWSDKYDNLPGAPECWMDGYDDGLDHPFDGDRYRECIFDVEPSESELCCNGCYIHRLSGVQLRFLRGTSIQANSLGAID